MIDDVVLYTTACTACGESFVVGILRGNVFRCPGCGSHSTEGFSRTKEENVLGPREISTDYETHYHRRSAKIPLFLEDLDAMKSQYIEKHLRPLTNTSGIVPPPHIILDDKKST